MQKFQVTGMSCAACSARVEKAVNALAGVESCSVSLLTNSMGVEGTAAPGDIIDAVIAAGYGASLQGAAESAEEKSEEVWEDKESAALIKRLCFSLAFLLPLMYFSMGHHMFGLPLPAFFSGNPLAMALVQMLLTIAVMVINQKFFISGTRAVLHRAPNMDTLVALGSMASFVYSVYALFAMSAALVAADLSGAQEYLSELYFESAAMILTLITVGKLLEARAKGKTTNALKSLIRLMPQTAVVVREGTEHTVPVEQVLPGEIYVVRPGENIPVDGVVLDGSSAVNESALTGESIPVDKTSGDDVSAGTINQSGYLRCQATRVGASTTLAQIIQLVNDAAATKAPIAKVADRVSGVFVPVVIIIALITTMVWLFLDSSLGFSLARGISVLVISCPCALGLATPVAIMVGNGLGARHGILFKTAVSLEETGKVSTVVLDKTGTITAGEPKVTDVIPVPGVSAQDLLRSACSLEQKSEHPLARAIRTEGDRLGLKPGEVDDFQALPGNGLSGRLEGKLLCGGNLRYMSGIVSVDNNMRSAAEELADQGKIPLFFSQDDRLLGLIAVADVVKDDSAQAISQLKAMGIRVVMLTGDNERTARVIGKQVGVDEVIAGVLPEGKEKALCRLMGKGKLIMVGDGINDAPALTRADIGIAIGAGTDVAIDAADIVLTKNSLLDVPAAICLSRATLRNIHQNLFWAFFYNAIGIPLAAGLLVPLGLTLNPMFGAAAMSLSSFFVVSNALRLNFFDPYAQHKDKAILQKHKEEKTMQKTMTITGMMCPHCEARVKKALEALAGVEQAVVSHEAGTAVVTLAADVPDAVLCSAVEAQDYPVVEIR